MKKIGTEKISVAEGPIPPSLLGLKWYLKYANRLISTEPFSQQSTAGRIRPYAPHWKSDAASA